MKVLIYKEECYPYFQLEDSKTKWNEEHELPYELVAEYRAVVKRHQELTEQIKTLIDYY